MKIYQVKSFLRHWLLRVDEHSLHSPFFYDFYKNVIKANSNTSDYTSIEELRNRLAQNHTAISVADLGATSHHFASTQRTIAQVAQTSITPAPWCKFVQRLLRYTRSKKVIELGTSMGIMSLYMATDPHVQVTTFEGNPDMVNIALTNFEFFKKQNINLVEGNIDKTLPNHLETPSKIDFVWMDANHRYEPTIRYFEALTLRMAEKGIIAIDDIYHSPEMARAWHELRQHDLVYGSLDLFRCGILFLDPTLNKQHFTCAV